MQVTDGQPARKFGASQGSCIWWGCEGNFTVVGTARYLLKNSNMELGISWLVRAPGGEECISTVPNYTEHTST